MNKSFLGRGGTGKNAHNDAGMGNTKPGSGIASARLPPAPSQVSSSLFLEPLRVPSKASLAFWDLSSPSTEHITQTLPRA
eukprot:761061-Hanusia_phi.AAC.6